MSHINPISRYKLIAEIRPETGLYPAVVRKTFRCGDNYWDDAGMSDFMGHRYLCLNSLGHSNKTPLEIITQVKANLGAVFPFGATGRNGQQQVILNNVFFLTLARFMVRVIAMDDWSFTLRTEFWHPLIGTARHGIFKDSADELWLMQEGIGEHRESSVRIGINYVGAPRMWRMMANKIRDIHLK